MPRIQLIDRWNEDPEYASLPGPEKQAILENYFDKNVADSDFQGLPDEEKTSIRNNFSSYHMPQETPAPPPEPPQPERLGLRIGRYVDDASTLAAAGVTGAVEGVATELTGIVGGAMEFAGTGTKQYIPEEPLRGAERLGVDPRIFVPDLESEILASVGKDLKDWAEAKKLQWFGPPKKREGLERIVYEGSKMLAPSVLPGAIVSKGIKVLSGVGKLVKAAKAAQIAGDVARATELMDKANKAANISVKIASGATASMFGLSQAQQTRDTAEEEARHLESQGKFEEAKDVRAQGEGMAPLGTGGVEAAGEYFGTKYLGKLFRLDEAGIAKRGAKNLVKDFLKTLGVEVFTEVGQQAGEAEIEKITGIRPEADPIAEALDVIGPTVFMTLLTGGLAGSIDTSREPTDSIDLLEVTKDETGPSHKKEPVDINLIKKKLKEFREEVTGPPSTAEEAAGAFFGREEVVREQLPGFKSAEESARVFQPDAQLGFAQDEELLRQPVSPAPTLPRAEPTPSTAREAAETLVGSEAVQEELEREEIQRRGLGIPEEPEREQIKRLGLQIPTIKSAEEAAQVFEEQAPTVPPSPEEAPPSPAPTQPTPALAEKEEIDATAHEAATSPLNATPQPTEAQKEAGNYKLGHVTIQGLDISIENPKGSVRSGKDSDGETWETEMKSHYGYIKGTVGKDKDHIDIFIGDSPNKDNVYVVDQINPDTGKFDEHKVLIGFGNMREARKGYRENYEKGWKGLGAITKMPVEEFKEWSVDEKKTKLPLKHKEKKRAPQIRRIKGEVLPTEKRELEEKKPGEVIVEPKETAVVKERPEEGRPDFQFEKEAGRKARDEEVLDYKVIPISKVKTTKGDTYRGVGLPGKSGVGVGTFSLGKGLYSTTDKKLTKGYEKTIGIRGGRPTKPLIIPRNLSFEDWLLKESGLNNIREFNSKYADPGVFVRSKGFNGVIYRDEIVKYAHLPEQAHRIEVEIAIKKGQFVPPNVLKEYPDLVKPEEIIEKPVEKYAVAEEKKPETPGRTRDLIESVFPGQEIKETDAGFEVTLKNGLKVDVERTAGIVPDPEQLRKTYGIPALPKGEYIAGAFIRPPGRGKTSLIRLVTSAGKVDLHHESIHLLQSFGIITKQESGRINRHIKQKGLWDKSKNTAENQADWLANEVNRPAPTSKLGKIWAKIKDFVDNLVNKLGVSTVRGIVRDVKTGKIFEREAVRRKAVPSEQYSVKREGGPLEESEEQPGLLRRQWDELVFQAQDKFHYLNKAQMEAARKRRAELPEGQDAYNAETRYHGIASAAIEDFEEEHIEPILDLMGDNDIDIDQLDDYLHARHAKEANAVLMERNPDRADNESLAGMTDNEADLILNHVSELPNSAAFEELGRMHDRITKAHRDILRESGQVSPETIEQWEDTYDFYAPLMREGKVSRMPRRGRGFDVRGREKIRAGSTRDVVNIFAHTVANTEAAMIRAEKLKVARTFLEFARNNPGPWEIDTVEYKPRFNAEGLIEYRPDPLYRDADNVMIVKEGGINHRIVFDESNLNAMRIASAMKNLDARNVGSLASTLLKVNRFLAMVNTSLNPEFIISNFLRDLQTAGYNMSDSQADKIKMKAFKDVKSAWRGIRDFQKGNKGTEWAKWYNQFRKAGAKVGWMQDYADVPGLQKDMVKKLKNMEADKKITVRRGLNSVMKFIENENTAVENAVRLSVFKNLIDNGVSETKAAVIAKELTVNFNRKGNMGQTLNAMYLFYNASIQGSARLVSAAKTSSKVRKLMIGTVAFAAALDILNRAVGGVDDDGEDRYDKIAPWIKERNMIIMLPDGKGYVQIMLPWGYNIFHVMGQVAGEAISKENFDPVEGATRIAGATISSFNPVGGEASILQVLSPTLFDPLVQWAENKDWAGRKLRPDSNVFAPKPSSQTYWNSVRAPSKTIAQKLNELTGGDVIKPGKVDISPEAIDLAINTITGGAGKFVGNLISVPIKLAKGEGLESYEIPILRRVYGKIGNQALTQQYYENMDAVRLVKRQYKHYIKDKKKLKEIRKQSPAEIKMLRYLEKKKISISKISREISGLRKSRIAAIKKGDKKRVDELNAKIEFGMRKFNKRYMRFKKEEK
jgi:hypothetical protein